MNPFFAKKANPLSKKSEPILQNEPIRILYPSHRLLTKRPLKNGLFSFYFRTVLERVRVPFESHSREPAPSQVFGLAHLSTLKNAQFCTLPIDFLPGFALCYLNFFTQFCTPPLNFLPGFAHYPSFFYSVLHTTPRFFTRFCTLQIAVFSFNLCKNCIITVQKLHLPRAKTAHINYSNKLKYKL